jgi:hypothetical protein
MDVSRRGQDRAAVTADPLTFAIRERKRLSLASHHDDAVRVLD